MLFNSLEFLFLFLPAAIAGFFLSGRRNIVFLCLASLVFYARGHAPDLLLLLASMGLNYIFGRRLQKKPSRVLLAAGVAANVGVVAWFKYAGFLAANINALTGGHLASPDLVLPLGVSFFTIHEITWLVDSFKGKLRPAPFSHHMLYISFFPQLIAGPIVRFGEVMDQYRDPRFGRFDSGRFAQGALLFCIGLCKKALLADVFGAACSPTFALAAGGLDVPMTQAWSAALFFTFQIYFDFSAYSDMAIGLGHVFGITLPQNFNSPYKATSIIDFWRRWHMTLSRFLRDYVYIPLGGGRVGTARRNLNLMLAMLIGGLWHGASWTFVVWGGLHGIYLLVNHAWRAAFPHEVKNDLHGLLYGALTFLAVVVAWVFFRAETFGGALAMLRGMAGLNGAGGGGIDALSWVSALAGGGIVWFAPNAAEIAEKFARMEGVGWRRACLGLGLLTGLAVFVSFTGLKSEFIYFHF